MSSRLKGVACIVALGVILSNLVIASSSALATFAPMPVSTTWLYAVAVICGFGLEIILDESTMIFYGVVLVALISVSIFSGVLIVVALQNNTAFMDLVLLFAFQQSVPRFVFLCVLGYFGTGVSLLLKLLAGRH